MDQRWSIGNNQFSCFIFILIRNYRRIIYSRFYTTCVRIPSAISMYRIIFFTFTDVIRCIKFVRATFRETRTREMCANALWGTRAIILCYIDWPWTIGLVCMWLRRNAWQTHPGCRRFARIHRRGFAHANRMAYVSITSRDVCRAIESRSTSSTQTSCFLCAIVFRVLLAFANGMRMDDWLASSAISNESCTYVKGMLHSANLLALTDFSSLFGFIFVILLKLLLYIHANKYDKNNCIIFLERNISNYLQPINSFQLCATLTSKFKNLFRSESAITTATLICKLCLDKLNIVNAFYWRKFDKYHWRESYIQNIFENISLIVVSFFTYR